MASLTVVFDLDGTLVDTAPDLVAALNHVLAGEGLPTVAYEDASTMVGGGARVLVERGLKASGRVLAAAETDRLVRNFIAYYASHIADGSRPFHGVEAALDRLAGDGCRLAVCTNKLEWLSVRLLDALGLGARFAAICGPDTFGVSKPDPEILRATVGRAGGELSRSVMIGDSITDITTARGAGVPVIAVDFGYSEIPVALLKPDRFVSTFADLPEAVFDLVQPGQGAIHRNC
jgi:phosphoglycolate phosphatase